MFTGLHSERSEKRPGEDPVQGGIEMSQANGYPGQQLTLEEWPPRMGATPVEPPATGEQWVDPNTINPSTNSWLGQEDQPTDNTVLVLPVELQYEPT